MMNKIFLRAERRSALGALSTELGRGQNHVRLLISLVTVSIPTLFVVFSLQSAGLAANPSIMISALDWTCTWLFASLGSLTFCERMRRAGLTNASTVIAVVHVSAVVAMFLGIGGGTLRRWVTGDLTHFDKPHDIIWYAIIIGWITGTLLGLFLRTASSQRMENALVPADGFALGIFAAFGMEAALRAQCKWGVSPLPSMFFLTTVLITLSAAATGCGGGILRNIIVYWPIRSLFSGPKIPIFNWGYIVVGAASGLFAYAAGLAILVLCGATLKEFFSCDQLIAPTATVVGMQITNEHKILLMYLLTAGFGCFACSWLDPVRDKEKPPTSGASPIDRLLRDD